MRNIINFIEQGAYVIIFLMSLLYLRLCMSEYEKMFQLQQNTGVQNIIYLEPYLVEEERITSSELLGSFLIELEYDVEVDGLLISKTENLMPYIYKLEKENKVYIKSYIYDHKGKLIRIRYSEYLKLG